MQRLSLQKGRLVSLQLSPDRALEFLADVGDMDGQVLIKNDQEPSIQYFIKDMVESRVSGRTHLEESPVKSSGSNGVVERGIHGVQGHVGVLFLASQGRLGSANRCEGKDCEFHS